MTTEIKLPPLPELGEYATIWERIIEWYDEPEAGTKALALSDKVDDEITATLQAYATAAVELNLAAQDAEIERLRVAVHEEQCRVTTSWDEIERLRADAERYRWLRGGSDIPPHSTRWARWEVRYWTGRYWETFFAEKIDTAIDAAMKETP